MDHRKADQLVKYPEFFMSLGPGRPGAGGPRMDRRAVTSSGVVKISRLTSRLRRSAWRGPDPTFLAKSILLFVSSIFQNS